MCFFMCFFMCFLLLGDFLRIGVACGIFVSEVYSDPLIDPISIRNL